MNIEFKYQTLFTCSVPDGYLTIKDFNERMETDEPLDADALVAVIRTSFEGAKIPLASLELSVDLNYCDVLVAGEETPLRIIIRARPSLVVGDNVYKLEEFDI
jgi:hypothetical protein